MTSHLGIMSLFALLVSIVFAALMRDEPREQILFGGKLLAGFVGLGVMAGWLLYLLPL